MSEYFDMQTESSPIFKLSEPWINYQKKNEFVPSHIHDDIIDLFYNFSIKLRNKFKERPVEIQKLPTI